MITEILSNPMSVLLLTVALCSGNVEAYLGSASMWVEKGSCQVCAGLCFCGRSLGLHS